MLPLMFTLKAGTEKNGADVPTREYYYTELVTTTGPANRQGQTLLTSFRALNMDAIADPYIDGV